MATLEPGVVQRCNPRQSEERGALWKGVNNISGEVEDISA
jgi:hypothetical protein